MELLGHLAVVVILAIAAIPPPAPATSIGPVALVSKLKSISDKCIKFVSTQEKVQKMNNKNKDVMPGLLNEVLDTIEQNFDKKTKIFLGAERIRLSLDRVDTKISKILASVTKIVHRIASTYQSLQMYTKLALPDDVRFNFAKTSTLKLFNDLLLNIELTLSCIDDAKESLSKATASLFYLQFVVQVASDSSTLSENTNIGNSENTIRNPPSRFIFWTDQDAVNDAKKAIQRSQELIKKINLVKENLMKHIQWMKKECEKIKVEAEDQRKDISKVLATVNGKKTDVDTVVDAAGITGRVHLPTYEKAIIEFVKQLRDESMESLTNADDGKRRRRQIDSSSTSIETPLQCYIRNTPSSSVTPPPPSSTSRLTTKFALPPSSTSRPTTKLSGKFRSSRPVSESKTSVDDTSSASSKEFRSPGPLSQPKTPVSTSSASTMVPPVSSFTATTTTSPRSNVTNSSVSVYRVDYIHDDVYALIDERRALIQNIYDFLLDKDCFKGTFSRYTRPMRTIKDVEFNSQMVLIFDKFITLEQAFSALNLTFEMTLDVFISDSKKNTLIDNEQFNAGIVRILENSKWPMNQFLNSRAKKIYSDMFNLLVTNYGKTKDIDHFQKIIFSEIGQFLKQLLASKKQVQRHDM